MNFFKPETVLKYIRYWPPYFFAGVSVDHFDLSKRTVTSKLTMSFWNQNYFGTHFGGSLFSMCDPFYVFILAHHLGRGYYVWDKTSEIEFVKAVNEPVYAEFSFTEQEIELIFEKTKEGKKYEPQVSTIVQTKDGVIVAKVKKVLYIKKKRPISKKLASSGEKLIQ